MSRCNTSPASLWCAALVGVFVSVWARTCLTCCMHLSLIPSLPWCMLGCLLGSVDSNFAKQRPCITTGRISWTAGWRVCSTRVASVYCVGKALVAWICLSFERIYMKCVTIFCVSLELVDLRASYMYSSRLIGSSCGRYSASLVH